MLFLCCVVCGLVFGLVMFLLYALVCARSVCLLLLLCWFLGVLACTLFAVLFVVVGGRVGECLDRCVHPVWLSRVFVCFLFVVLLLFLSRVAAFPLGAVLHFLGKLLSRAVFFKLYFVIL